MVGNSSENFFTRGFLVIPVFNRANFIADAIESALAQDHPCTEIIVVDDGSTDGTPDILRSVASKVIVIRTENLGVSNARNTGLSEATGSLVYFLDSDDILEPDAVSDFLRCRRTLQPDCITVGRARTFHTSRPEMVEESEIYAVDGYIPGQFLAPAYLLTGVMSCSLCLYPTSLMRQVGGFKHDMSFGEDYDLNARLAVAGARFFATGTAVVRIRIHTGPRLSRIVTEEKFERLLVSIEDVIDRASPVFDGGPSSHASIRLAQWLWTIGRMCFRHKYDDVGERAIILATRLGGRRARKGSPLALTMYNVLTPRDYEICIGALKRLLGWATALRLNHR